MSVKRAAIGSILVSGLACNPSVRPPKQDHDVDWVVGTWSEVLPDATDNDNNSPWFTQYTFTADGTALDQRAGLSVSDGISRQWEARSDGEVAMLGEDGDGFVEWLFSPLDCNTLEVRYVEQNGSVEGPGKVYRGEVCSRAPDPEIHSYYEFYWCDEPPPPCDEE